jgi:deoxyribonuclease-4
MSIAGGVENAPVRGQAVGCDTIQLFTKSNVQWRAFSLTATKVRRFGENCVAAGIRKPFGHTSYLINLAASDREIYRRSVNGLLVEASRAEKLGLLYLVLHPGSHGGDGIEAGIERVVRALDRVHRGTPGFRLRILLETTAGQGSSIGASFEELATIIGAVREADRLGVCFDTCHAFAAGYDLRSRKAYRATMRELDRQIGLDRVLAFHLNDSKRELGSRVDRHAHIGEGQLGLDAFRWLLNDRRFAGRPMVLETPKGKETSNDIMNLERLRSLLK